MSSCFRTAVMTLSLWNKGNITERYILKYTVILSTYRTNIIIQLFRFTCTNGIQRTVVVTEDIHTM